MKECNIIYHDSGNECLHLNEVPSSKSCQCWSVFDHDIWSDTPQFKMIFGRALHRGSSRGGRARMLGTSGWRQSAVTTLAPQL